MERVHAANKATYRDVPAGRFHFEVRTTDRDGFLSDVARLEVRVTPSPQRHIEHMLRASHQGFISQSPAMAEILEQVASMAESDLPVLVLGETGVGKGVLARFIHDLSPRRAKPFIAVNSGGLSTGVILQVLHEVLGMRYFATLSMTRARGRVGGVVGRDGRVVGGGVVVGGDS